MVVSSSPPKGVLKTPAAIFSACTAKAVSAILRKSVFFNFILIPFIN
jgi:hypothetical protein